MGVVVGDRVRLSLACLSAALLAVCSVSIVAPVLQSYTVLALQADPTLARYLDQEPLDPVPAAQGQAAPPSKTLMEAALIDEELTEEQLLVSLRACSWRTA